jgi:hypothetical protein
MTTPDFLQNAVRINKSQPTRPDFLEGAAPYQAPEKYPGFRTAAQVPLGYVHARYTWPLDLLKMAASGGAENLLKEMEEFTPTSQEAAERSNIIPTQSDVERFVEKKTEIPLEAKTKLQKLLRMGTEAATFKPGNLLTKGVAGVTAPGVAEGLKAAGVQEDLADVLGFTASGAAPELSVSKISKPSGLTSRQFEKITKPTSVSPERHKKISESVESDFKKITENLLSKHPNYQSITSDPLYKEKLSNNLNQVEQLAENIPQNFKRQNLYAFMKRRLNTARREMKGITPTESEETFNKEFENAIGRVKEGPERFDTKALVRQYRKNNLELADYFEPGKSKAYNTGKRDSLLEYNRSIEELFDTVFPNSEFSNYFKEQNRLWREMSDVESIEESLGKVFGEEKIKFNELNKLMDPGRANLRRPFQRMMGKEGFKDFELLLRDMKSIENPYVLLKKSDAAGYKTLARLAGEYLLHPDLAKAGTAWELAKTGLRALLDKPQIAVEWKSALDFLKQKKLPEAQASFEKLDKDVKATIEKTRPFAKQARTIPEEYAETRPEMATEVIPKDYDFKPNQDVLKKFSLKEKPIPLTKFDVAVAQEESPKLSKDMEVLFKNQWDNLMPQEMYHYYKNPQKFEKDYNRKMVFGDFIKNQKLRKVYKDVLDVPVDITNRGLTAGEGGLYGLSKDNLEFPPELVNYVLKDPTFRVSPQLFDWLLEMGYLDRRGKGKIVIRPGFSPATFYSSLIHEGHHAFQAQEKIFKPFLSVGRTKSYKTKAGLTISPFASNAQYWEKRIEIGARLAEKAATKDLIKARNAAIKTREYQKSFPK